MRRRPVCILCMLLVVFSVCDRLAGIFLKGGIHCHSLCRHDQKASGIHHLRGRWSGAGRMKIFNLYILNTYLIYNSEKVSIDNIKVYLKQKRIIAVTVMLINFWQEVLFWCRKTGRGAKSHESGRI